MKKYRGLVVIDYAGIKRYVPFGFQPSPMVVVCITFLIPLRYKGSMVLVISVIYPIQALAVLRLPYFRVENRERSISS